MRVTAPLPRGPRTPATRPAPVPGASVRICSGELHGAEHPARDRQRLDAQRADIGRCCSPGASVRSASVSIRAPRRDADNTDTGTYTALFGFRKGVNRLRGRRRILRLDRMPRGCPGIGGHGRRDARCRSRHRHQLDSAADRRRRGHGRLRGRAPDHGHQHGPRRRPHRHDLLRRRRGRLRGHRRTTRRATRRWARSG